MKKIIIGLDLSLNHFGICSLDLESGKVFETGFLTDIKGFLGTKSTNYEYYLTPYFLRKRKEENKDNFIARRRSFVSSKTWKCIFQMLYHFFDKSGVILGRINFDNVYIAMEDYAFGIHSRAILENAEVCGILKDMFYNHGINLRLIDPLSLKKWATNDGHCLKKEMVDAVWKEGYGISAKLTKEVIKKIKKEDVKEYDGPGTDLADAYFLARMLKEELLVRSGDIEIKDLPENRREIFLRVSERFPVNLVARPFISKAKECSKH